MYMCLHMCLIFKIDLLVFFYFSFYFFHHFFNTECMLLIMYKAKVSISDSLLLPSFSNHVVN